MKRALLAVPAVLLLAACGSSAATATSLAQKIPGCAGATADTPSSIETEEVTCTLPDGALITIGTFASGSSEQQWIGDGGSPSTPNPAYAGCCIQGQGWAATVGGNSNLTPLEPDYKTVIAALGGRQVNG